MKTQRKTEEQREAEFRAQFDDEAKVITRHMIWEAARTANIQRLDDPRVEILSKLADAFEKYDHQLRWLTEKLNDEVRKLNHYGTGAIYTTVLSTSLIDDVKQAAAAFDTLKSAMVWGGLFHFADDPAHDAIDTLALAITK